MAPVCTSCIISSPGWHQHAPCWTQRFTAQAFNKTDLGFYLAQETFQRTETEREALRWFAVLLKQQWFHTEMVNWASTLFVYVIYIYLYVVLVFWSPVDHFSKQVMFFVLLLFHYVLFFVIVLIVTVRFQRCVASIPSQIPGSVAMPRHRHGVTGRLTVVSSW